MHRTVCEEMCVLMKEREREGKWVNSCLSERLMMSCEMESACDNERMKEEKNRRLTFLIYFCRIKREHLLSRFR